MAEDRTKSNPLAKKFEWKEKFIKRYEKLTDFETFKDFSTRYPRKSIRVNTIKADVEATKHSIEQKGFTLTPVPWCKEAFWIEGERRDYGNLLEHALGHIYIQDAASMIPPIVLNPQPHERVLDMCAAPGSKTTQIAAMMNNTGIVIANDSDSSRLAALGINVQRSGLKNVMITNMKGHLFAKTNLLFDKILLDAPCSGTGTIRKSLRTIQSWNPGVVKKICSIQKNLLVTAWNLLKPGGVLVYSTCTLEPEENEQVVDFALKKFEDCSVIPFEINLKRSAPIMEFEGKTFHPDVQHTLRIWPQDNDTEGFYVAKLQKNVDRQHK
ncbi:RsmB/NOP family class I SAM-dependent RNA methyltransferase [Candidatus Woesearchaeota archaeon]|nr:MAG: RsmB/NOP family class I SAM-dependent RNA methyltransferase [Candidatus Woesearchaeota archaeon]